jgi:DNA gyrase subunit A
MSMAKQRDRVLPRLIEEEMRESFLDYSMSVIVQRALPDVRDGLKPVHRRILYAMHEAGLSPNRPYKKSATVVGDVLGKYHPHGDSAVYDSMVRMVQDFSLRYPLVDGQGNFGSIDGDNAAAYRYTEAKLAPIATEMLADIDRETVDFSPNFDDRLLEPKVLPARIPNLLVNGSSGIAVGMSTNIPPHNLREVVRAAIHLLDHPQCTVADLVAHVPGPDFPTGGIIVGTRGIHDAYEKGRGRVVMRARVYREQKRNGREQLVVTEIPYGTNKSRIIEQIADLSKQGRLPDVSDLRDESDRDGIRMVVELKRGGNAEKTLAGLFKWTSLQATFGVITLALENGVPREFNLLELLQRFRDHRIEVVVRRSRWELERARDQAHVLEGLLTALKNIDKVVQLIRSSRNRETAAGKLRKELKLSEKQADAILNMRLSRLTALESREIRERLDELKKSIAELEAILASPERQVAVVRRELQEMEERYGDDRRTEIVPDEKGLTLQDLVAEEEVVVIVSREGYVKQVPMGLFRRRTGRGKRLAGMERYENDYLEHVFVASTGDTLLFFTEDGKVHWLPVRDIPEAGRASRGKSVQQLAGVPKGARVVSMLPVSAFTEDRMLVFATTEGTVKRTCLDQYARPKPGGGEALVVKDGDRLVDVQVTDGSSDVVLATSAGRAIRFPEAEVSPQGRVAQGMRGVKLKSGERVVGLLAVRRDAELCLVTARGFAKRVALEELPVQGRGGTGNVVLPTGKETGEVVGARELLPDEDLMAVTMVGRTLRVVGGAVLLADGKARADQVLDLSGHDRVVEVTRVAEPAESPDSGDADEDAEADALELEGDVLEVAADRGGGDELELGLF